VQTGPIIHGVTFTWWSDSAQAIYIDYEGATVPGGAQIYNNVFNNNVKTIQSRYQEDGVSIRVDSATRTTTPSDVYGNTIHGGPQSAILMNAPGSKVYANAINSGNPTGVQTKGVCSPAPVGCQYTNDFAVLQWCKSCEVYGNTITAQEGRGISQDAVEGPTTGSYSQGNNITVTELPNNPEYQGCETGGAYGVQFDDSGVGQSISNVIEADKKACQAIGLRLTATGTPSPTSSGSTYLGKLLTGYVTPGWNQEAAGVGIDGGGGGFVGTGDSYIGDSASIFVDWDGITGPIVLLQPTLGRGPMNLPLTTNVATNPGYRTFAFSNGGTSICAFCLVVVDPTFTNGAMPTSADFSVAINNGKTASYSIEWSVTGTAIGASGKQISGATVTFTNKQGTEFQTTTNSAGQFSFKYPNAIDQFDNTNGTQVVHNPYTVSTSAPGCTTNSGPQTITGTTVLSITLAGC
jgi:hypothetical protein